MGDDQSEREKRLNARRKSVYEKVQESDIELCQKVFLEADKENTGYITYFELKLALEKCGVSFFYSQCFHKMISELKDQNGLISFFDFTKMVVNHKKGAEGKEDLLDAFVAMGGMEDGGGNIDADKLVSIIKNDFGMTIDIEGLIKETDVDNSGEIDFEEFQSLLLSDDENPEIEQFRSWFMF
jgi:Ca2+-binding EF-hand superfamily protein